jgi:ABC-type molybdate transport system substrate-binding protein
MKEFQSKLTLCIIYCSCLLMLCCQSSQDQSAKLAKPTKPAKSVKPAKLFIASSLAKPIEQFLKSHPELPAYQIVSAGSQELSLMIEQGDTPALFISAHEKDFQKLIDQKRFKYSEIWLCNQLVLVGAADLLSLEALTKVQSIGIASPTVPLGTYTKQMIEKMPKDWQNLFLAKVKLQTLNASQLTQYLQLNEIDVAVLYQSDLSLFPKLPFTTLTDEQQVHTAYYLVYQDEEEPIVSLLKSNQKAFSAKGFYLPPLSTNLEKPTTCSSR